MRLVGEGRETPWSLPRDKHDYDEMCDARAHRDEEEMRQ